MAIRAVILVVGIVALIAIEAYLNDSGFFTFLSSYWAAFLLPLIVGIGWVLTGSPSDQAWEGLKAAFPDQFTQSELPRYSAVGPVQLANTEAQPTGPVIASAADEGFLISKFRKRPKPKHFICVPWSRIVKIRVGEPKELARCKSADDCWRLAEKLTAEAHITRGHYPTLKLTVPWHDMFGGVLPPHVELQKGWRWPYALPTAHFA